MSARQRDERPPRLYGIADDAALAPRSLAYGFEALAQAGVRWIQIRAKGLADKELLRQLELCCAVAADLGVRVWVNDRADLAAILPVFGVHVGQLDLAPALVRRVLGAERSIGLSTHNLRQARAAQQNDDVDVVAIGPIFATRSKQQPDSVVGIEGLRQVREVVTKPLVAIGGIDAGNVAEVLAGGADSVAVISAVCAAPSIAVSARRLLDTITSAFGSPGESESARPRLGKASVATP